MHGRIELEVLSSAVSLVAEQETVACELPSGMRVDTCTLDQFLAECRAGDRLTIRLELLCLQDVQSCVETGEFIETIVAESKSGVSSVGLRDAEWMTSNFALRLLKQAGGNSVLMSEYEVLQDSEITIEAAMASVMNPKTRTEGNSPWFAVDKAMKF